MKKKTLITAFLFLMTTWAGHAQHTFESDTLKTQPGNLIITFIGHGTLMFQFDGKVIHVDPVRREADYTKLPAADLILITHEHGDHLDPKAIETLYQEGTKIVLTKKCAERIDRDAIVMKNGDQK
ncbi:MAG: MBL fold metallo-hydrolase, partial [bacterium]|nr:MBL fold metallo-hydrolase [bacterium]